MTGKFILAMFLALATLGTASAAVVPVFIGMNDVGGGVSSYTYDIFVESPGERIQFATTSGLGNVPPGGFDNHFTFFDFFGYVAGSASCTGSSAGAGFCGNFNLSVANIGPAAFVQTPPDSGSVPNLTWTYNNAASTIPAGSYLGRVSINSTSNVQGSVYFSGQSTKSTGSQEGTVTGNTLTTVGPVIAIPEPATMLLMGIGLIALGLVHKKFSRT